MGIFGPEPVGVAKRIQHVFGRLFSYSDKSFLLPTGVIMCRTFAVPAEKAFNQDSLFHSHEETWKFKVQSLMKKC